jgi:hypothetical protein
MIVSPDLVPSGTGIVTQKILEVQQEILMLNRHQREHVAGDGRIAQPTKSCPHCQNDNNHKEKQVDGHKNHEDCGKRKIATLNEIEREVGISNKNACVLLPKTWVGKRVRIVLVNDD